jgi:hypothetical protein
MKRIYTLFIIILFPQLLNSAIIKYDNGEPGGSYFGSRVRWEESVLLKPDGPCYVNKIMVHLSGETAGKDTLWIVGDPSDGGLPPTEFVWHYNALAEPIIIDYDGNPGWREFDISDEELRMGGFDRLCIQHSINPGGPYFTYDSDGPMSPATSYLCDALTPNPDFYNIMGTLFYLPKGDFMVRMEVDYIYPDGRGGSLPAPPASMPDVSVHAGITDGNGNSLRSPIATAADVNSDGYDDIIIKSNVFINQRNGTFEDQSDKFNLRNSSGQGFRGTVWADVDNDGHMDCFGARGNGGDAMLWGTPSGTMTLGDNPELVIDQPTITPMWLDYDTDGRLDLFVAYGRRTENNQEVYFQDKLFHNLGDRNFENVTDGSGIPAAESAPYYDCWGASISDYNNDNLPDPFVATYRLAPDLLYKNLGNAKFDEVGEKTGVRGVRTAYPNYFGHGMGSDWGDYDNDGDLDLAVGNLGHPDSRGLASNPSLIFRNEGPPDYHFTEIHQTLRLKFFEMNAGIVWLDLDLDGLLDIYHCQYAYYKRGDGNDKLSRLYINSKDENNFHLKDMTWETGAVVHGAWSPVRLDYDNDGDMDLLIASSNEYIKLFRNDMQRRGNWASFRIRGNRSEGVPREGFGTSITVEAGGKTYFRSLPGVVMTARSSQNTNELHFGLGDTDIIDKITVNYPNGESTEATDIPVNGKYIIPYKMAPQLHNLAAPALKYPRNFEAGVPITTSFKWHPVQGAEEYVFILYDSENNILKNSIISDPSASVTSDMELTDGKIYSYEVMAKGMGNSAVSSKWIFMVGQPTADAPELIAPAQEEFPVSLTPQFEWTESNYTAPSVLNVHYDMEISTDELFNQNTNIIYSLNTLKYKYKEALQPGTQYFWRVRGVINGNPGPWSETGVFTTFPVPAKVQLNSPEPGDTTTTKPQFEWQELAHADNYDIQVATDEDFEYIAKEFSGINNNHFKFFPRFAEGATYYWHIRGVNEAGNGPWSDTWHFITEGEYSVDDNPLPEGFGLSGCRPNPVEHSGEIIFSTPRPARVKLELFDLSGRLRIAIADNEFPPGNNSAGFDSGDLPPGLYYCRMTAGGGSAVVKIVITK